jgi:GH15 family glucan-1,4-alpha-glucosidase
VRVGNAAALQPQNDTYGSIILAVFHMFFDERLPRPGDEPLFRLLETMGTKCKELALEPDAGLWEYRARRLVHTHSAAMCWAGCDRLAGIAARLGLPDRAKFWSKTAASIRAALLEKAWNAERGAFTGAFGSTDLDASGLLLAELGLVAADDPRFVATVNAIEKELLRHNHVMRYLGADDFGLPETAFLVCRFWLIDAWWSMGRREQAREYFEETLRYRNRFGLLSEDIHPQTGELWGNFPQTYSMGGLIVTATRLSRSWEDRHWLD